ncbi:hypothetical protein VCR29J2_360018 [Vibrio coralliirubri]|nr:hypothetical protein VCR29J2_360018 [Vibrio coralliirubri]
MEPRRSVSITFDLSAGIGSELLGATDKLRKPAQYDATDSNKSRCWTAAFW